MVQETVPKDVEAYSSPIDPDLVGAIQVVGEIVEIDDCDSDAAWSVHSGAGVTIALETTEVKEGTGSIKVTVPAGIDGIVKATFSVKDLSALNSIRVWLKDLSITGSFYLYFGESAYNEQATSSFQILTSEWKEKEWVISGISEASRDAVTIFAVRLNNTGGAQAKIFLIDYARGVKPAKVRVCLPEGVVTGWPFPSAAFPFRVRNARIWSEVQLVNGYSEYTVPSGKVWVLLHAYSQVTSVVKIDDDVWEFPLDLSAYEKAITLGRLLKAGKKIKLDTNSDSYNPRAWILEVDADPDIEVVTNEKITDSTTYTVPSGKVLCITAILETSGTPYLKADDVEIFRPDQFNTNLLGIGCCLFFTAGIVLKSSTSAEIKFCGYLTDETRGQ